MGSQKEMTKIALDVSVDLSEDVNVDLSEDVDVDLSEDVAVDVSEDLKLLKITLPLQKKQLQTIAIRNKLAKPSRQLVNNFLKHVRRWTKKGKFTRLSLGDIKIVYEFTDKIQHECDTVTKAKNAENVDVSFDPNEVTVATLISKSAEDYITAKNKRVKKANKLYLLSTTMLYALEELTTTKLEINDYNQTIQYLIKCSDHLTKLKEAWGEIKTFFQ